MRTKPRTIRVSVVVSGQAVEFASPANYSVRAVCNRAALKSGNVVTMAGWEIRATDGRALGLEERIGSLARDDDTLTIWLAPRAGVGGNVEATP